MSRFDPHGDDDDGNERRFQRTVISVPEKKKAPAVKGESIEPIKTHLTVRDLETIALKKVRELDKMSFFKRVCAFFYLVGLSGDIKDQEQTGVFL